MGVNDETGEDELPILLRPEQITRQARNRLGLYQSNIRRENKKCKIESSDALKNAATSSHKQLVYLKDVFNAFNCIF